VSFVPLHADVVATSVNSPEETRWGTSIFMAGAVALASTVYIAAIAPSGESRIVPGFPTACFSRSMSRGSWGASLTFGAGVLFPDRGKDVSP